jgi:uncharacterized Fe-S cluster-containing radical SAM superfamily protein
MLEGDSTKMTSGKVPVYDHIEKKVLLAKFTASDGMKADNEGKATSRLSDYIRTKTYVKTKDMLCPSYPIFPQPYQLAQDLLGGEWNDYNECAVIQIADCNLDCWYCYVPKELRSGLPECDGVQLGDWFTVDEVYDLFQNTGKKVWRISGGEPTIAPDFVLDLMDKADFDQVLMWLDSNMSTGHTFFEKLALRPTIEQEFIAMCGCFKGFTPMDCASITKCGVGLLDVQFDFAHKMVMDTNFNVFWYVPGVVGEGVTEWYIRMFFERMVEEVDPRAPLRTYILEVKPYTSTEDEGWQKYSPTLETGRRPIEVWNELLEEYYEPELLWLPNHQVKLLNRG